MLTRFNIFLGSRNTSAESETTRKLVGSSQSPSNVYSALILRTWWNVSVVTWGWCYWQSRSVCVHLSLQDKRLPLEGCWCLLFCVGERAGQVQSITASKYRTRADSDVKVSRWSRRRHFFSRSPASFDLCLRPRARCFCFGLCIRDRITPGGVQTLEARLCK